MTEILAEHQWYDATTSNEDPAIGCSGCDDWLGSEDALNDETFAAHQTAALVAAGYGLVKEARARMLRDAAEVLIWNRHDKLLCNDYEACYVVGVDWLRGWAAAIEADQ